MQSPMRTNGDGLAAVQTSHGGETRHVAPPPPPPGSPTPQEDDLDEMLQQIELDQQKGHNGLPWSDSADSA